MSASHAGRCACGAITYTVGSEPLAVVNCHCRDCQRASGTAFSTVAVFPASSVVANGSPKWHATRADNGSSVKRAFCTECGSPLFSASDSMPDYLVIKVASFDDPGRFRPQLDIWTARALPWTVMDPGTKKRERDARSS